MRNTVEIKLKIKLVDRIRGWKLNRIKVIEMHIGLGMTPATISRSTGISESTINNTLSYYYIQKPVNPITIVLQSKINEPEKPEE